MQRFGPSATVIESAAAGQIVTFVRLTDGTRPMAVRYLRQIIFASSVGFFSSLLSTVPASGQEHSPEAKQKEQEVKPLLVRLVDESGHPVPNARLGFSASYGDMSYTDSSWHYLPNPESLDAFPEEIRSDRNGIARIPEGLRIRDKFRIALVARHEAKRLVGLENLERGSGSEVVLTMRPECRVTGRLVCPSLLDSGDELQRIVLNVHREGMLCIEYYSVTPDFQIFLPAGRYRLTSYGGNNGTLTAQHELVVPSGVASIDLYPIELALAARQHLIGKKAPELRDVIAWKSNGPNSLRDLRGSVVLLDFWGYWCASCISGIPKLIELHDRYSDRGLVIVGIHVDAGGRIDNLDAYIEFEKSLKNGVLMDREIPYPVVLAPDQPSPQAGSATKEATCKIAADYGVESYPTLILIDRNGIVAGEFRHTPEGMELLQTLLDADGSDD